MGGMARGEERDRAGRRADEWRHWSVGGGLIARIEDGLVGLWVKKMGLWGVKGGH